MKSNKKKYTILGIIIIVILIVIVHHYTTLKSRIEREFPGVVSVQMKTNSQANTYCVPAGVGPNNYYQIKYTSLTVPEIFKIADKIGEANPKMGVIVLLNIHEQHEGYQAMLGGNKLSYIVQKMKYDTDNFTVVKGGETYAWSIDGKKIIKIPPSTEFPKDTWFRKHNPI